MDHSLRELATLRMCWWDPKSTTAISTGSIASVLGFLPRKLYNALRVKPSGSLEIATSELVVPRALACHRDSLQLPPRKLFCSSSCFHPGVVEFLPASFGTGGSSTGSRRCGFQAGSTFATAATLGRGSTRRPSVREPFPLTR